MKANPKVHYVTDSDHNPAVCQRVSFICAPGSTRVDRLVACAACPLADSVTR